MLKKLLSLVLVVAVSTVGFTGQVAATMIGTQEALRTESHQARVGEVQALLARSDIAEAMVSMGVDPAEASLRVAALSEAELVELRDQLETAPAGGVLAVLGVVLIVFIILDLTGVVKIFRR